MSKCGKAKREKPEQIVQLKARRRNATSKLERDAISKQLLRTLQVERKRQRHDKLERIIERGGGRNAVQAFAQIPRTRKRIVRIRSEDGQLHTEQSSIADVFADFYEKLYSSSRAHCTPNMGAERATIPAVATEELQTFIKKLKKGRTCADDGLLAEMLQTNCQDLLESIASLFTDILRGHACAPSSWKRSRLFVLFKKGEPELPKNYRPIAIIPVLC